VGFAFRTPQTIKAGSRDDTRGFQPFVARRWDGLTNLARCIEAAETESSIRRIRSSLSIRMSSACICIKLSSESGIVLQGHLDSTSTILEWENSRQHESYRIGDWRHPDGLAGCLILPTPCETGIEAERLWPRRTILDGRSFLQVL